MAGRRVADAAADVLAIADAYGLEKFSVVGRSGGGPHALACAALLPGRTTRAAVLVGLAPHGADGLDWFDGMARSNVIEFTAAANGYEDIVAHTKAVARRGPGQPRQPDRQAPGRTARPGPAGGGGSGHPVDADRDLRRGAADVGLRLDRRRAGVLLALGVRPGNRQGARLALARRERRILPGQPRPVARRPGSPARPWWCRPVPPISARWTCFRTSSGGCPRGRSVDHEHAESTDSAGAIGSDLLRFQVAVDPLPFLQLRGVRVTGPQDPAEVSEDPCPEFLGFGFPACLAQVTARLASQTSVSG